MYLYDRGSDGFYGIANTNGRMRVGRGVQNNAIMVNIGLLNLVDQFPFNIGLKVRERNFRKFGFQSFKIGIKGLTAIDFRFACSQEI